ncbi:MAG: hypothetical protein GMKNLPBB_00836 [Myxococcota bacterium]|nr:hypothetical protein [Myxococcota bacterium]
MKRAIPLVIGIVIVLAGGLYLFLLRETGRPAVRNEVPEEKLPKLLQIIPARTKPALVAWTSTPGADWDFYAGMPLRKAAARADRFRQFLSDKLGAHPVLMRLLEAREADGQFVRLFARGAGGAVYLIDGKPHALLVAEADPALLAAGKIFQSYWSDADSAEFTVENTVCVHLYKKGTKDPLLHYAVMGSWLVASDHQPLLEETVARARGREIEGLMDLKVFPQLKGDGKTDRLLGVNSEWLKERSGVQKLVLTSVPGDPAGQARIAWALPEGVTVTAGTVPPGHLDAVPATAAIYVSWSPAADLWRFHVGEWPGETIAHYIAGKQYGGVNTENMSLLTGSAAAVAVQETRFNDLGHYIPRLALLLDSKDPGLLASAIRAFLEASVSEGYRGNDDRVNGMRLAHFERGSSEPKPGVLQLRNGVAASLDKDMLKALADTAAGGQLSLGAANVFQNMKGDVYLRIHGPTMRATMDSYLSSIARRLPRGADTFAGGDVLALAMAALEFQTLDAVVDYEPGKASGVLRFRRAP